MKLDMKPTCPDCGQPFSSRDMLDAIDGLLAACEASLDYIEKLSTAWRRGAISGHDRLGGTTSL